MGSTLRLACSSGRGLESGRLRGGFAGLVDPAPGLGVEEVEPLRVDDELDLLALPRTRVRSSLATNKLPFSFVCSCVASIASLPTAAATSAPRTGRPPDPKWTYTSEPMSSRMSITAGSASPVRRRSPTRLASSRSSGRMPSDHRLPLESSKRGARVQELVVDGETVVAEVDGQPSVCPDEVGADEIHRR